MSKLRVTAEPLVIHPHDNADALELAQVGLYRAVVLKGQFQTGDYGIYIPEQAIVPDDLLAELNLTGKLAGPQHNRVKVIRLRGEVSQGIVALPKALEGVDLAQAHAEGTDFAELLGITKWIPEIPKNMGGDVFASADMLRWVDIENLQRYPDIFTAGEPVTATEKLHGTCCLTTYIAETGEVLVTSKGLGEQRLALKEDERNLYWTAVRAWHVEKAAAQIATRTGAARVGIFAEVFGVGVQDLHYGATARKGQPGYAVFDIALEVNGQTFWVDQDEMVAILADLDVELPTVPRLYDGPYDAQLLLDLATGREQFSGTEANIREGVVIRPKNERYSDLLGDRAIAKIVSVAYLSRKGGTEYN